MVDVDFIRNKYGKTFHKAVVVHVVVHVKHAKRKMRAVVTFYQPTKLSSPPPPIPHITLLPHTTLGDWATASHLHTVSAMGDKAGYKIRIMMANANMWLQLIDGLAQTFRLTLKVTKHTKCDVYVRVIHQVPLDDFGMLFQC